MMFHTKKPLKNAQDVFAGTRPMNGRWMPVGKVEEVSWEVPGPTVGVVNGLPFTSFRG